MKFSLKYIHPNYLFYYFKWCLWVCPNFSSAPCTYARYTPQKVQDSTASEGKRWPRPTVSPLLRQILGQIPTQGQDSVTMKMNKCMQTRKQDGNDQNFWWKYYTPENSLEKKKFWDFSKKKLWYQQGQVRYHTGTNFWIKNLSVLLSYGSINSNIRNRVPRYLSTVNFLW